MVKLIWISLLFYSSFSFAVTFEIEVPCSQDNRLSLDLILDKDISVGELTLLIFNENNISYIGNEKGFNSIMGSPIGLDALEVVSDKELNAYGWCFSINDTLPESFANTIKVLPNDKIKWWYGYAHYDEGVWTSQCRPSFKRINSHFCRTLVLDK